MPDHRSTAMVYDGDRQSMVAVNDGRRWRTIVDHRRTTVDHHRTIGQRWLIGRVRSGHGPGQVGSWAESGSGRPRGMPHVSHVCTRVSHVCPRGIHVDADVDIITTRESNPRPLAQRLKGYPKSQLS
nr:hypothetical protein [Tanacetum cinerariifolium]